MTYKKTAEAYVREKCPELMELSFGCEVELWTDNGKPYDEGAAMTSATGVILYETLDYYTVLYTGGVNGRMGSYPKVISGEPNKSRISEIIGHPIQLNHWLRVLQGEAFRTLTQREEHYQGKVVPDNELLVWHETGTQVFFNLTTGQPATEADYQAFCEIVGISNK